MRNNKFDMKKTSRASVSIMLSFLMLPVYTFGAVVTDGVRLSSARTITESAADMAADSGLSDFDGVLESVYGLFAVSSSEEELKKNLSDYFYRTINNTALTEEDEESRKYIQSLADFFSDPSGADFDNLINLNTEAFDAEFTEGAVLANPEVMKSQITEYMKYTGPLKMSSGLLKKLEVFKDFEVQNKALNAKIDYDKSLEKINKYCRDIYDNASNYNQYISDSSFPGSGDAAENAGKVRDLYKKAVSELILYKNIQETDISVSYNKETEKYIYDLADDAGQRIFDVAADMLDRYIISENGDDSGFTAMLKDVLNESDKYIMVRRVSEITGELSYIKTFTDVYFREFSGLSDEEKSSRYSEYNRVCSLSDLAWSIEETAHSVINNWKNDADMKCAEAAELLGKFCTASDTAAEYLENIRYDIESLLVSVDEAEKAGQRWQDSISALSDGDVKTSMQNEYDSGVKALNRDDISDYLEITEKNLDAVKELRRYAENLKFHGISVCDCFSYSDKYIPLITDSSVSSVESADELAADETDRYLTSDYIVTPGGWTKQAGEYSFYKYLHEVFGNTSVSSDSKSAQNFISSLNSLGNPENLKPEIPETASSDILSNISEKKLDAIQSYLTVTENTDDGFSAESADGDTEESLNSSQAILSSAGSFLSGVSKLSSEAAGEGIEDVLVTEYIMQMFSCYTSDKEIKNGKVTSVKPVMLSGVEMNSDNNVFYRSEAEYILWGNENMENNLAYTRTLIFGTRFALNSVYAFTDSEIRTVTTTAATAIAGWTGFGVPVVKTVLILSLALAESVTDLEELLSGDSVPVYKNSSTWTMKPSGLINALVNNSGEIVDAVTEKTGKKVEDIFQKLDDSSEGGIDGLTDTLNGFVDDLAKESSDAAVNTINNIIFSTAEEIIENGDETISREKITQMIIGKLQSAVSDGSSLESMVYEEFRKLAVSRADEIADIVLNCWKSASGGTKEKIEDAKKEADKKIREVVNSLRDDVKDSISEIGSSVKETVSEGIHSAGEYAGEYAKDIAGNLVTGAATKLTEQFGSAVADTAASATKAPSAASSVTLTYKEYLRIFLLLSSASEEKERAMLSRTAVLVDINMNNGMKNAEVNGRKLSSAGDFDISKAHSMITVDADVSVRTWFLGAFVPDAVSSDDSDEHSSDRTKIISVRSVLSY